MVLVVYIEGRTFKHLLIYNSNPICSRLLRQGKFLSFLFIVFNVSFIIYYNLNNPIPKRGRYYVVKEDINRLFVFIYFLYLLIFCYLLLNFITFIFSLVVNTNLMSCQCSSSIYNSRDCY